MGRQIVMKWLEHQLRSNYNIVKEAEQGIGTWSVCDTNSVYQTEECDC